MRNMVQRAGTPAAEATREKQSMKQKNRTPLTSRLAPVLLASSLAIGSFGCAGSPPQEEAVVPIDPAIEFSLNDLDGAPHPILDGRSPTILAFWATWCRPCRRELPELAALHAEFGERARFLGVLSGEEKHVNEREARNLLAKAAVRYPQLRDSDGKLSKTFGVKGTPTVVVLGPDGQLRYHGTTLPPRWEDLLE